MDAVATGFGIFNIFNALAIQRGRTVLRQRPQPTLKLKKANAMKLQHITLACVLLSALAGCGGGSDSSGAPDASSVPVVTGFDTSEFEGTWTRTDGTDTYCFGFSEYGGKYRGHNLPVVITATTVTNSVTVFNDTECKDKAGVFTATHSISWSAVTLPGKTNVARAEVVLTGYTTVPEGSGPDIKFTSPPVIGTTDKTLLDVEGTKLFFADEDSPLTADGYPTTLSPTALYTK